MQLLSLHVGLPNECLLVLRMSAQLEHCSALVCSLPAFAMLYIPMKGIKV